MPGRRDVTDAWQAAASDAGIRLTASEISHASIQWPESELSQVLDVLLDNAIKYAGQDAEVDLSFTVDHDTARIAVRDNGPGLPDEELHLASKRFWRSSRHNAQRGTGLGLAIVDKLVAARGGRLELRRAEPQGLVVRLDLPLAGRGLA